MNKENKFLGFLQKLNKSHVKKDDEDSILEFKAAGILEAIGTKSNIVTFDACATRIRLIVKDTSLINEPSLKELGASGIIKLNSNNVQIVIGTVSILLVHHMKILINNT